MLITEAPLPSYIEAELRRIGIIDSREVELPSGEDDEEIKKILIEFDENGEPNF